MRGFMRIGSCLGVSVALLMWALPACNTPKDPTLASKDKEKEKGAHDRDHPDEGPHGGPLADWDDVFHAEFTVDHKTKQATIYILDDKAKGTPKIAVEKISKVKLSLTSEKPVIHVELKHNDQLPSDKGIPFVGTHDIFTKPIEIKGTISGTLDGKPYINEFTYKPKQEMLRELFLKPGGVYSAADIKANGAVTAAEKFKDKLAKHAKELAPGDKLCPVTDKKAEATFTWIVKGQSYEFCCPPCVNNFIEWAHFEPENIKDAKEYVFKGK